MMAEKMYTPPPIKGYRPLSQETVDLINEVKAAGEALDDVIERAQLHGIDPRWGGIAKPIFSKGAWHWSAQ